MSEVRLVLLDAQREISGTCHGSTAQRTIAALSAGPETLEELESALTRFEQPSNQGFFEWFREGINDESYDAGLIVIDLAPMLIACDSTYCSASHRGAVEYHDGHSATKDSIQYRLSDDWQIISDAWNWRPQSEARRRERQPPIDARAVLYGSPVLEWIAFECLQAFRSLPASIKTSEQPSKPAFQSFDDEGPPRSDAEYDAVKDMHARWLLTSRPDLRNRSPREVLLSQKDFINGDLQDREFQWSTQDRCPPGIEPISHAYRFGGFGTHEIVIYYYLLRRLHWSCRDQVAEFAARPHAEMMTAGDFLATEVPRLEILRDQWLDQPDREYHGRTPRSIIDRERRRLPEGMSGHDAIIDHDCPLCQMMADGISGPMFWHLDGCNMDWDFAFSFEPTREAWEAEQRSWEDFNRTFDAREAERNRLGVKYPGPGYSDPDYVWQRSLVADECDGMPLELRLFGIGSHLAELIVDLKQPTENRPLTDQLSRDFGNLRDIAHSDDVARATALAETVIDRFCNTLAEAAAARDNLRPKCDDLCERLRRFFEPPTERDDPEPTDDDVPY